MTNCCKGESRDRCQVISLNSTSYHYVTVALLCTTSKSKWIEERRSERAHEKLEKWELGPDFRFRWKTIYSPSSLEMVLDKDNETKFRMNNAIIRIFIWKIVRNCSFAGSTWFGGVGHECTRGPSATHRQNRLWWPIQSARPHDRDWRIDGAEFGQAMHGR